MDVLAKYDRMCPNCGETITTNLLTKAKNEEGITVEVQIDGKNVELPFKVEVTKDLKKEIKDFEEFCKEKGYELLSIQKSWAKRVFKKHSFSIVAQQE